MGQTPWRDYLCPARKLDGTNTCLSRYGRSPSPGARATAALSRERRKPRASRHPIERAGLRGVRAAELALGGVKHEPEDEVGVTTEF